LRYTTSHPRDMSDELIEAHRDVEKLMPFLHLPVQSGSDVMLEAMNRGHTIDTYRRIIDRLRAARPDIALSSDFIIGFPGESDDDFAATLALVRELGFAQAFSFKYSKRPGTPGAALRAQIAEGVKSERLQILQELIEQNQRRFNDSLVGRVLPVLFEKPGRHPGQLVGRSPYLQWVHAQAPSRCQGTIMPVRITGARPNSLAGEVETVAEVMA
jgi:tRNA-2-methylthio-N6-dimethylallyladenosine synthase